MATIMEPGSRAQSSSANRAVAEEFLDCIFNRRDFASARRLLAADFRHHEPSVAPGAAGLLTHLAEHLSKCPALRLSAVRHICDGDFVVAHNRRRNGLEIIAAIDILRIVEGKVAEYWHVFQQVPAKLANRNGMF